MSAIDYPVTFGYGEWDGVYYTSARPHRGNDRACEVGVTVSIGSDIVGLTGATGWVSGPHLHTQAGWDMWVQNTTDPSPHEFQPGTVVQTGFASQWGNYVIVETELAFVCYAHLSEIWVSIGQKVGYGEAPRPVISTGEYVDRIKSMYWRLLGREADQDGIDHYSAYANGNGWGFVYDDLKNSEEGQRDWEWRNPDRVRSLETGVIDRDRIITELRNALSAEQNKPAREVIKEVEKIIEKPVEVIKYIDKPVDEGQVVKGWFDRLLDKILSWNK